MARHQIIVVSSLVDATIREYQPDVDFRLFRNLNELGEYVNTQVLRASCLFFTKDVLTNVNSGLSYLADLTENNNFLHVDEVIYITEKGSNELDAVNFIIKEKELTTWKIVEGSLTRSYIHEVINGTYREDIASLKHKGVYRVPRSDYIKQQLRNKDSLAEDYEDDDTYYQDIPDVEPIYVEPTRVEEVLKRVYVAGLPCLERTAFAFLVAQYLSLTSKTIIVESDNDYHTLTELFTKSGVDACVIDISRLVSAPEHMLNAIRKTTQNLVVITCVERIPFNYRFIMSLLFYNLISDFDYIINEVAIEEVPNKTNCIVTVPNTMLGTLKTGEMIDQSFVPYCSFAGVNLKHLPEIHLNSSKVMSTILSDILSTQDIKCPIVTLSSLRLNTGTYDLGSIIGKGAFK